MSTVYDDADANLPVVVVVGNYGVGKSSFVRALLGNTLDAPNTQQVDGSAGNGVSLESQSHSHSTNTNSEFQLEQNELIVEPHTITIDNEQVRIVDTAARDVTGTQQQMQAADLVIVLINASSPKSIEDLDEYWIEQCNDISLYSPVVACFNQIDRLSSTELSALQEKLNTPTKEHFVLEEKLYVSAHTNAGIVECKSSIINILRDVRTRPRWILIDPYTWQLHEAFLCALHRIFRLLDRDCDFVLNLHELEFFNTQILHEEFTAKSYNFLLRRLNEQSDTFVTPQGLTFRGFKHLMKRFAIAKKWDRCWDVLRFYHYQTDLTLHPRVFPKLPPKEADQTFELSKYVYVLLEKIFAVFADDTIDDHDNKSIASSMISSVQQNVLAHQYQRGGGGGGIGDDDEDNALDSEEDEDDNDDEGKVLSMDGIKHILAVLPAGKPELHCTLLDRHVIDHFETAGRKLNKLTKNGWLSFWAMFAVENAQLCFKQLTYLDLATNTDRSSWYKLTARKMYDAEKAEIQRSVVRVLLFGGPQCGKTVFCDRLLCRVPISRKHKTTHTHLAPHKQTTFFRAVSNRIGASHEYNFLAITEVPSTAAYIEQAMDNFLAAYDMILLVFDLSESRSFFELIKIFDRMPKHHALPIQVVATKADLPHVTQYNLEAHLPDIVAAASAASASPSDARPTNVKYDVDDALKQMGLAKYEPTFLTARDSSNFPNLFDSLYFIATHPQFRRLKKSHDRNRQKHVAWQTMIRRTIGITLGIGLGIVITLGTYKLYKW
eukprot:CAMPEP_0202703636 /NCGR_PEP_ID=MMETSP1385-20130828/16451_1 /ASSEMBLY_ACC=CAM_ASM_000861 /TAXON_ID=933848 /ORGANISM="Elphidium margaritaceum" /LENGTH=774 /DNA_ID=CAMNT_0049361519 /DNA_START=15 /DNA_END=2336 /DNA_ORIENTATION=-